MVVITMCFFFKQKTAYEMRISDWSSDVCSSDLPRQGHDVAVGETVRIARRPGDGGLIKAAAAEIVAPVAERACEQPILPPDRGDGRNAEIGRASCRERVCQYV